MSLQFLFWILAALIIYTYVGYGLILWLLVKIKRLLARVQTVDSTNFLPKLTLIIPAYNEKAYLAAKIANTQTLNYPKDRLQVWVVTDGSDDGSPQWLQQFDGIQVFHKNERAGKMAAVNRVMPLVKTELVVFTDANTMLESNALKALVTAFKDKKVGCVAGEKRVRTASKAVASEGEGLYWRYESTLKAWSSELNSAIGAAGELFGLRTALYQAPPSDTLLDDFILSLQVVRKGYTIAYTPDAYALETGSANLEEELKRKVRIAAGGIQSILRTGDLLNPFKHPLFAFQYVSHRVLRWTVTPLALVAIFFLNILLSYQLGQVYTLLLVGQILFYGFAFWGWRQRSGKVSKLFLIPCYFSMMNIAVFLGIWRYMRQQQSVCWESAKRLSPVEDAPEVA